MTRQEHLDWAKERALEVCNKGQWLGAFITFQSDMSKHDETKDHIALAIMSALVTNGHISSPAQMKHFIEGFN